MIRLADLLVCCFAVGVLDLSLYALVHVLDF